MTTTTHLTAAADQLATELRESRCCDPFDLCDTHRVKNLTVQVSRRLASVPSIPAQRIAQEA